VGIAMVLNHLADKKLSLSALKASYPSYAIVKEKVKVEDDNQIPILLEKIKNAYLDERINEVDGLKIDFAEGWVHIRGSNTEPVVRVIAESKTPAAAKEIVDNILNLIND